MSEAAVQAATLLELQRQWPQGLFYRRNVGGLIDKTGRMVRFGLKGQADIAGIIEGRAVEVEIKSATGRQTTEQKRWQAAVERAGGLYVLSRSVEEAIEQVKQGL